MSTVLSNLWVWLKIKLKIDCLLFNFMSVSPVTKSTNDHVVLNLSLKDKILYVSEKKTLKRRKNTWRIFVELFFPEDTYSVLLLGIWFANILQCGFPKNFPMSFYDSITNWLFLIICNLKKYSTATQVFFSHWI